MHGRVPLDSHQGLTSPEADNQWPVWFLDTGTEQEFTEAGYDGPAIAARACPAFRRLLQRVKYLKLQGVRGGEGADHQPGGAQPLAEPVHGGPIRIGQRGRQAGWLIKQEYQPGQAGSASLIEFQLGIRHGLAWHYRAIPESDHGDIDLALTDPPSAVVGWLAVAGGEVAHIDRSHADPAYGVKGSLHK